MSRQTNFYAAPGDTEMIHRWLLTEFPRLKIVSQRRGPLAHASPVDASEPGAFWRYPVSCLVPTWAEPLLYVEDLAPDFPGEFIITAQDSPIIQYHPCHWEEATKTVTRSRFYWAYHGELPAEALRQINRLFRWVRANTVAIQGNWRIFPEAARCAQNIRQDLSDRLIPNPFFQGSQSISM